MDVSCLKIIEQTGFITTVPDYCRSKNYHKKITPTVEDYVGKLTNLFMPFLKDNISEKAFLSLQEKTGILLNELITSDTAYYKHKKKGGKK